MSLSTNNIDEYINIQHNKSEPPSYNHYQVNKFKNFANNDLVSLKSFNLRDEIVKVDDNEIYHEILADNIFHLSIPSTPTSLYNYIDLVDDTSSINSQNNYYHYPVFKFSSLLLENENFITPDYLQLDDVSLDSLEINQKPKSFQAVKDRFLSMSLFEKRQWYKCGREFVTLDEIPPWSKSIKEQTSSPLSSINDKISIFLGNITTLEVDAIVNAANGSLKNGRGGVDGCIHFAADEHFLENECQTLNGCETGQCKITGGYRLPAKYIIHCVGPITWIVGESPKLLSSCYKNALETLKENNLRTIAFPCISTGSYGYPKEQAANVVLHTIKTWLQDQINQASVDRIVLVLFFHQDFDLYNQLLPKYFPLKNSENFLIDFFNQQKAEHFQIVKDRFLSMSLSEKRQWYVCGSKFVTLDQIPAWSKSSKKQTSSLSSINDKISIFMGNITTLEIDVIVNAAKESLKGGEGGVDGCIHFASGYENLQNECRTLNGCEPGQCKITGGYRLPAKYIIHCVGSLGKNPKLLSSCYRNALETLKKNKLRTIAFPCISTGAFWYPNEEAANVALKTIKSWLKDPVNQESVDRIIFVLFSRQDIIYNELLPKYFPL